MADESGKSLDELVRRALDSKEQIRKPEEEKPLMSGVLAGVLMSDWAAPVFAAMATASNNLYLDLPSLELTLTDKIATLATTAASAYASARLFRQDVLLDRTQPVFRKSSGLFSKLLFIPFNYSGHFALPLGLFLAEKALSQATGVGFSDIPKSPDYLYSYASALLSFAVPYITTSYVLASSTFGKVIHPETLKAIGTAASAFSHAHSGRYEAAASELERLMERPMGYRFALHLQNAIGDMQVLSGNTAALETYIAALSTRNTHYVGRGDTLIFPFLYAIRRIARKARKPAWAEEQGASGIISAAHEISNGKLRKAAKILLSTVAKNQESLLAHRARSAFLRATWQDRTADLETRVCADLITQDPNAKMERVEGRNRNTVYFSGNIVLKQFEDKDLAERESSVITRFRQSFGPSIIYTLPVYRRGDFYYLLSERGPITLLELIKQKKARLEDFIPAIRLMVDIQRVGLELHERKELHLNDSILHINGSDPGTLYFAQRRLQAVENIERYNGVVMPQSYRAALGYESRFIDLELAGSEMLTMYKDSGPKNFLKGLFGLTQAIDFEAQSLRLLPPQMDFINLTESVPYLNSKQLAFLQMIYFRLLQDANKRVLDRQNFARTHLFSGLQWHDERLIYSTREAHQAKTPEEREERKMDQVWHLVRARECLDDILKGGYLSDNDLKAALSDQEELARPIFDPEEQKRLEFAVGNERHRTLEQAIQPLVKIKYVPADLSWRVKA